MSSTSETGHAKNVANFQDIISFCNGYGAAYNPSNVNLQLTALQTLHTNAEAGLLNVKTVKTTFDNEVNARQTAFLTVKSLATKIVNSLAASGAANLIVQDAKTINRKIQGKSSGTNTPPATPPATPPNNISTSQQSYDSQIDHMEKLVQLVTQEPLYTPNEKDLQVASLNTFIAGLKTTNTAVVNANTAYSNARIQRDNLLYDVKTGLVQTALDVKKYIKSLFGAGSPQYKQVSKIKFTGKPAA